MNIKYYDLYYTVIKSTDDNEIVVDKYENDYNIYNGFLTLIIISEDKIILKC